MNSWYKVKVRHIKQFEDGRLKKVVEFYLIDAMSFTEAEARAYEEIGSHVRDEFLINAITKVEYADIFLYDDADVWNEATIKYITVDPDSGKERKTTQKYLVTAHTPKEAYIRIEESLQGMMVSYEITAVKETKIVDVFPFTGDRNATPHDEPSVAEELGSKAGSAIAEAAEQASKE